MKNTFNYKIHLIALVCILGGFLFLSSCEEEEASSEVILLSFGPSGVHHGDEITFFGQNLDKVSSIVFQPAVEISKSAFSSVTSDRINVIVPEAAEAGKVILKTPKGDIESITILNFEVPVEIESITEEVKPGETLTMTGDKLNWIEQITFPSDLILTKEDFESQSLTELVVTVPMEAQTGFLLFATGGTKPLTFGSEEQLIVKLPAVTSIAPAAIRHTAELTITGTDLDLVTKIDFEGASVSKSAFVSHTETTIVLAVPATTKTGNFKLIQQSPVEITAGPVSIILPVGSALSPSPAKPGEDVITITGTDLDLIGKLILPGAGEIASTSFVSHSATEIKLAVPASATQGAVEYITIHNYKGSLGVVLKLPSTGGLPTLDYYIYKDGLQTGWSAWGGWGHVSQDYNNADNPAAGEKAIKTVFNNPYGAIQIHNDGPTGIFSGYNYLVFYVLVTGEDSNIIVQIGDNADYYPPAFTKDKYHQIVVPLASLASAGNVSELRIKNNNADAATNNTTVYVDEIGLTIDPPLGLLPDLGIAIYDDQINNPLKAGGWGAATTQFSNDENPRGGTRSIKATYSGGWGGNAQIGNWDDNNYVNTAGMQYFVFSIFGGAGTGGKMIQINMKTDPGANATSVQVAIEAGKWKDVKIPLADFGNPSTIGEFSFQDTDWAGVIFIDQIGLQ